MSNVEPLQAAPKQPDDRVLRAAPDVLPGRVPMHGAALLAEARMRVGDVQRDKLPLLRLGETKVMQLDAKRLVPQVAKHVPRPEVYQLPAHCRIVVATHRERDHRPARDRDSDHQHPKPSRPHSKVHQVV